MDQYQFIVRFLEPTVLGLVILTTITCVLKGKRVLATLGAAATGLALWLVLVSWNTSGGLEDLRELIIFGYVVLPLAAVMVVGAIRLGRPGSWWLRRVSGERGRERARARFAAAGTMERPLAGNRDRRSRHFQESHPGVEEPMTQHDRTVRSGK